MSIDGNEPAFRVSDSWLKGLSKREYFAAAILCGIAAHDGSMDPKNDAELAVKYADALIEALGES